jgi:chromosome segregation ATPase
MNHPTREEFNRLGAKQKQLEEEIHKLRQQVTEEIKTVKVEVSSADVQNRLDNHTEFLKELDRKSDQHTQAFVYVETLLKEHSRGIGMLQTDVAAFRTDMQKRLDAIAEVQKLILERLPERGE